MITLVLNYVTMTWVGQRTVTKNKAFFPSIVVEAFQVTDEMAAKGIEDDLEPPKQLKAFGDVFNEYLKQIARFKEKFHQE